MLNLRSWSTWLVVVLAVLSALGVVAGLAGSLEPPAPPDPTMKTLDDVEPRIPIRAHQLPIHIYEPGSYYLAENVDTTGDGIHVHTDNVTIDLMGHTLSGGTGTGVYAMGRAEIVVMNGTVTNWERKGVHVGSYGVVRNVRAISNGEEGIFTQSYSMVADSTVALNQGDGIFAELSLIRNCVASHNKGHGIKGRTQSYVTGCSVELNDLDGIFVEYRCVVKDNRSVAQGMAGIRVDGRFSRVEGNHVSDNDIGIRINESGNTIIKNSATFNSTDYSIVAGNDVGPIGPAATATSPWANIEF